MRECDDEELRDREVAMTWQKTVMAARRCTASRAKRGMLWRRKGARGNPGRHFRDRHHPQLARELTATNDTVATVSNAHISRVHSHQW